MFSVKDKSSLNSFRLYLDKYVLRWWWQSYGQFIFKLINLNSQIQFKNTTLVTINYLMFPNRLHYAGLMSALPGVINQIIRQRRKSYDTSGQTMMHLNPDSGTSEFILIWPKVCATVHNTSRNSHQVYAIGSDYRTLCIQDTVHRCI